MELIDIYDSNKNLTGKIIERTRNAKLKDDEYFLYVQCWILNSKREILLTQRKKDKLHGGMWEPTGGCVISGETSIEGIKRELHEEIGIEVSSKDLILRETIKEERKYRNCFRDIYIIQKDIDLNDLKFNDGEVVNAKFVTIDEFKDMLDRKEVNEWLKRFIEIYKNI